MRDGSQRSVDVVVVVVDNGVKSRCSPELTRANASKKQLDATNSRNLGLKLATARTTVTAVSTGLGYSTLFAC